MTIKELEKMIQERGRSGHYDFVPLDGGIVIESHDGTLYLTDDAGDRTICGYIDPISENWHIYRAWYIALIETFGALPGHLVIDA